MFLDARTLPDGTLVECDICIVGGGAAGITLAHEFDGHAKVCLLESGGLDFDLDAHTLSDAEDAGSWKVQPEIARLRFFGGSTNHWGGNCAPLDETDYEAAEWIPYSGWPIRLEELARFHKRARAYCQIDGQDFRPGFDAAAWAAERPGFAKVRIPVDGDTLAEKVFLHSPPTLFGNVYRSGFESPSSTVTVYLHANGLELETDPDGTKVEALHAGCLTGSRFRVRARHFILAAGLENARLLLVSNRVHANGLGNVHDRVGRYLMDHLNLKAGRVLLHAPEDIALYYDVEHIQPDIPFCIGLQLSPEVRRREGLLNYTAFLRASYEGEQSRAVLAVRRLRKTLGRGAFGRDVLDDIASVITDFDNLSRAAYRKMFGGADLAVLELHNFLEQAPDPESRITLSDQRDALGMRRMRIQWQFGELEKRTLVRAQELIAQAFGMHDIGRVQLALTSPDDPWPESMTGAHHFMGTTRMSADPRHGVVDADCKVHGIGNLFIAGGSVFPTGGATMVTFNIVALALRLADHIKHESI